MRMSLQPTPTCGKQQRLLKGKFIALSTHIKKLESSQIDNLMLNLTLLEKQKEISLSKWKQIKKIQAKTSEFDTKE
jgi:hypothetical protein